MLTKNKKGHNKNQEREKPGPKSAKRNAFSEEKAQRIKDFTGGTTRFSQLMKAAGDELELSPAAMTKVLRGDDVPETHVDYIDEVIQANVEDGVDQLLLLLWKLDQGKKKVSVGLPDIMAIYRALNFLTKGHVERDYYATKERGKAPV